ncbi:MAG: helix-turn-helix transcriptional regulator, partial [Oscillospiraceae bacterium]
MKFCDKLRDLRKSAGLTQEALAEKAELSLRTVKNYEAGASYPKQREVYKRFAAIFNVEVNYLLTEDEEFIITAAQSYGSAGARDAGGVLEQAAALFAGGELSDDDKLAFMTEIQGLYLESK